MGFLKYSTYTAILLLIAALLFLNGCLFGDSASPNEQVCNGTKHTVIIDQSGKKLSIYNVECNKMNADVADVGDACNDIIPFNGWLYLVNSTSNTIQVFNFSSRILAATINMPTGCNPYLLGANSFNLFVTGLISGKVYVIDKNNTLADSINAGSKPQGVYADEECLYTALGNYEYGDNFSVIYGQGMLMRISLADTSSRDTLNVGTNPMQVIAYNENIFVSCVGDYAAKNSFIYKINKADFQLADSVDLGVIGAAGLMRVNSLGTLYIQPGWGGTALLVLNASDMKLEQGITVDSAVAGIGGIAVDSEDNVFVASSVWAGEDNGLFRIAAGTNKAVKLTDVAGSPTSLVVVEE